MTRRIAAAVVALLLVSSTPALARDPLLEDDSFDPAPAEPDPDPAPFVAPPPGVYYVTDTYVADVVTTSGPLTTYSTTTIPESTGSYARVLESVSTGVASVYDGRAFNGRRSLGDGRLVAGTYYENYVLSGGEFVPVSVVFFQDDAELARVQFIEPQPHGGSTSQPPTVPSDTTPPASRCCAAERGVDVATLRAATPRPIRTVLSLRPMTAPLAMVEVLRGRPVELWPRAFVDDREVPVRSWAVLAGETGEAVATTGSGAVPFRTSWVRLAAPGAAHVIVFRIEVQSPEGYRTADGSIGVVVRSPALEN